MVWCCWAPACWRPVTGWAPACWRPVTSCTLSYSVLVTSLLVTSYLWAPLLGTSLLVISYTKFNLLFLGFFNQNLRSGVWLGASLLATRNIDKGCSPNKVILVHCTSCLYERCKLDPSSHYRLEANGSSDTRLMPLRPVCVLTGNLNMEPNQVMQIM